MLKVGWILFIGGLVVVAGYVIYLFVTDPDIPIAIRIGAPSAVVGVVLLIMGVGRERYRSAKKESFKEIER